MPKINRADVDFEIELPDKLTHGQAERYLEHHLAARTEAATKAKRTVERFPNEPVAVFNRCALVAAIRCGWVHGLIEENVGSVAPPWKVTWASQTLIPVISAFRLVPKAPSSPPPTLPKESGEETEAE